MGNLKTQILFLAFFIPTLFLQAQNASDFFPVNDLSHTWNYQVYSLDTLGNPVESSLYYEIDSLATFGNYYNKDAFVVLSKKGTASSLPLQPYLDSTFINLENSVGNIYLGNLLAQYMAGILGESGNNYSNWYPVYDFAVLPFQTVELFRVDTTITIDSVTIPARLTIERQRLSDELIQTELGLFTTKKFVLSFNIYYRAIIPIKILSIPTTYWLAEDNWVVKERRESTWISYQDLGIPPIFIPGNEKKIVLSITGINDTKTTPLQFSLKQNFPNPFFKGSGENPTTTIKYSIPSLHNLNPASLQNVHLDIYDILGRKVKTLVNKVQSPGYYSVTLDATKLTSGVYFYTLSVGKFSQTKKMLLLK